MQQKSDAQNSARFCRSRIDQVLIFAAKMVGSDKRDIPSLKTEPKVITAAHPKIKPKIPPKSPQVETLALAAL